MSDSNIADVRAWLNAFVDDFNFTRKGTVEETLGRDIGFKIAERIAKRAEQDHAGTEGPWPPNEAKYAKRKERDYGVIDAPNVRTGDMLSQRALYGQTTIDAHLITMRYGTDDVPTRAASGAPLKARDAKKTDKEKAYFAHTGQSKLRVIRKFYQVDSSDARAVAELAQANLNDMIRAANAANGYS